MPGIVELWAQRCLLQSRLAQAATAHPFASQRADSSGTVIMEAAFTQEKFYKVPLHCARAPHRRVLVPACSPLPVSGLRRLSVPLSALRHEDIVRGRRRGHGLGVGPERHGAPACGFKSGVHDAVVAYSAPPAHFPEADAFITRALNTYFDGGPDKWNFRNEDSRFRNVVFSGGSKVIAKLRKAKSRLPAAFYGGDLPPHPLYRQVVQGAAGR
jgi:hypothetical protein